MPNMSEVRRIMDIGTAMRMYATTDKEKFCCSYPEWQKLRPDSTFYSDFSVADVYGLKAINDTFKRSFSAWKSNYKMLTELTAALNHKLWFWYNHGVNDYSMLYDKLWKKADAYGIGHLKGEELQHFSYVLD